ncbi:MAG: hypothetical protein Fur0032_03510 [Terrimicrobiaceae bacterium]
MAQMDLYDAPEPGGEGIESIAEVPGLPVPDSGVLTGGASEAGSDDARWKWPWDLSIFGESFWDFPIDFTAALRQGYDTNVLTSRTDPIESAYTNISFGTAYEFGGPRLQLATSLGFGVTYYYNRPGRPYDYSGSLNINLAYELNRKATITFLNETRYVPDTDFQIVGGSIRNNDEYLYQSSNLSFSYLLSPRWSTLTSYNFTAFYYLDPVINEFQGRVSQSLSESIRLLVKPTTTLSLIYRVNPVVYFGEDLNSFGNFLLAGVDHVFTPRWSVSLQGGAEYRLNQNPVDGQSTYLGPFLDSSIRYQFGPRSTLVGSVRYGTEASDVRNVTQTTVFRFGLNAEHGITRRLSVSLGLNYQNRYYDQPNVIPDYTEQVFSISAGTKFKINRVFSLEAGYSYSAITSIEQPSNDYTRQIIFIGGAIEI